MVVALARISHSAGWRAPDKLVREAGYRPNFAFSSKTVAW
jgi:hypothetical protein